jgi:hypothetical protein
MLFYSAAKRTPTSWFFENLWHPPHFFLIHLLSTVKNSIGPSNKYIFRVGVGDILILLTV